mmetsp:Transcript_12942/g.37184  ORF Transcript_12942/g.37184 Transcript_12942/m.37184 type:complete len:90 (+) Transcript_12942:744-1013(+)
MVVVLLAGDLGMWQAQMMGLVHLLPMAVPGVAMAVPGVAVPGVEMEMAVREVEVASGVGTTERLSSTSYLVANITSERERIVAFITGEG